MKYKPITQKWLVTIIIVLLLFLLLAYFLFLISKSRSFQFFGTIISHVNTDQKVIALTFDDAPTPHTNQILDTLRHENIKATFYLVGSAMEKYPHETQNIVNDGHEIGNHTYSHQRMIFKTPGFIENEISKTNQLIRNFGFQNDITFRPPNGKKLFLLPWYLFQNQITTITWDIEPDTFAANDAPEIIKYTLKNTRPGSIILLHPFCETDCQADRDALPQIIKQLKSQGYSFVTVSQLLTYSQ